MTRSHFEHFSERFLSFEHAVMKIQKNDYAPEYCYTKQVNRNKSKTIEHPPDAFRISNPR